MCTGEYGIVYKAHLTRGGLPQLVAVKMVKGIYMYICMIVYNIHVHTQTHSHTHTHSLPPSLSLSLSPLSLPLPLPLPLSLPLSLSPPLSPPPPPPPPLSPSLSLRTGFFGITDIQKMMEEIVIMQQFNHNNVLRLLGVVVVGLSGPSIVMPFMANGNLSSYLRKNQETVILPNTADTDTVRMYAIITFTYLTLSSLSAYYT